jgi:signal transduction histidine kinase
MNPNDKMWVILITLIILLLIAAIVITVFISNRQRLQHDVKVAGMEADYEKELRNVEQEVQEHTMSYISQELHDNIGQMLTYVHLQIELEKQDQGNPWSERLVSMGDAVNQTIQQVRLLSKSLSSDFIEHGGLLHAIDVEVERLRQLEKVAIAWENDGAEPDLNKNQRIMSFRIFQEIINNTLKHSSARTLMINMRGKGTFQLTISDDGQGFDLAEQLKSNNGSGLKNIIKRATLAQLKCDIKSGLGKGCQYALAPLNARPTSTLPGGD